MNKWIRSFIFLLFALTTQWVQAQSVAKVGTTEYATIEEAVAAWGPGKTLTLLANVTTTSTVTVEVNDTKSTQNWTLDLGDYTWTASGCNAFKLYAAGGTVMNQNYGLKIYANQNGGITASGKYCIQCTYDNASAGYRPRLEIHGGTYKGSYIIFYNNGTASSNGPSIHLSNGNDGTEPVFNGNFALSKCPTTINSGYFNGTSFKTYPVSSTADTNLNGGHFKNINAFPSPGNNKGIKYGTRRLLIKSDASIDVINGAPTTYEASTTQYTSILSGYRQYNGSSSSFYPGLIYFESANYAIQNYNIPIKLNENVVATQNKTISSSATLTIDATAAGSSYTGNVVLANNNAKLVMIFPEGNGHYGVSVNSGTLHVVETVADGIVTRTYSRIGTVSNPEAKVGNTSYSTVYDAFYAIDGTTDNKTIVLQKNVTNAGIITNGTATGGDGKTVAIFDLNGHSIGIGSVGAGNNADYTLTIIDSSTDKTGTVTNTSASLFILGLTGINDYSGTYTLKIQAGTWMFDPSNVTINGTTYNMVDVGYVAHDNGNGTWTVGEKPMVAQIGTQKYETIDAAVAAANEGETIEVIAAGDYTLPSLPKNVTIEGKADGEVSFTHTTAGNIAGVPNGATFKNITINWGNVNYHGFQHAGTINMEGCTLNGKFFSYGDMNFTNCEFNQSDPSNPDYHMWAYSGNVTYTDCTFTNDVTGKFINVYNEDGATKYTVTTTNCTFINNGSSNKAALNVKATSGSNLLAYDVFINNCSTQGSFPEASSSAALVVLNSIAQVDDRTASGVDNITVTHDGVLIYPATVAAIGETRYPTLQSALDAAHEMEGNVTVELIDDITEYSFVYQKAGLNITIDGADKTINGQIIIDGNGRLSGTETLTIQNIKFNGDKSNFYSDLDAFVMIPTFKTEGTPYFTNAYNYAHNITVSHCTFTSTSTSEEFDVIGVKVPSKAGAQNIVITDCTGSNLHSLAQLTGTTGGTIENNTVTLGESFLNVNGGDGEFTVSNNVFTSAEGASGYGVRENAGSTANITLTGNTFTATNPVVLGKGSSNTNGTISVVDGIYNGTLKKDIAENATGKIVVSGGYFNEEVPQEFIIEGKVCVPATDMEGYFTIGDPHYVAQIGETKYVTLADAVAAVPTDGNETTIVMIDDETIKGNNGPIIATTQNVKLDLNGKTVTLSVTESKGSQLITNRGTLTITDSSEGQAGKLTNIADESLAVGSWPTNNYVTNVITNSGTLNMEAGTVVNTANGSICYAIDNNSTSYDAILNINGGLLTAQGTVVRQFCNSTNKQNVLNMTGGVVTTQGSAAIWTQLPGNNASSKKLATLNISGGEIAASSNVWYDYSFGDSFEAVEYNVTGGKFKGDFYSDAVATGVKPGFITGGIFDSNTYVYQGNTYDSDWLGLLAEGLTAVDNTDEATKDEYPYTVGPAEIIYTWYDNGNEVNEYMLFVTPFEKNYLMDGESITLLDNITLTDDVLCQMTEGTANLNLGNYKITGGKIAIKPGVTISVDKNQNYFVPAEEGYIVVRSLVDNRNNFTLAEPEVEFTATNGTITYQMFNTTISKSGTYKLLKDVTASSYINPSSMATNVTIDFNGHTLTSTATDEAILLSRPGSQAVNLHKVLNLIDSSEDGGGKLLVNPNADHAILLNNVGSSKATYNDVTIGQGVTIEGGSVSMLSANSTLTVEGTINGGNNFAIVTNGGTTTNTDITIKDGAVLTSNAVALYLPGTGTTTIEEGVTITGSTGIYVKSGTLNISGGEITGNGESAEYTYWNNGCYSTGNALVVDNCGYPGEEPVVSVTGGTFTSENSNAIGSYSYGENESLTEFISGGYFSDQVAQELIEEGLVCIPALDKPGYYTIGVVPSSSLIVFHDSGTYEESFEVPMFTRLTSADIYYKVNGGEPQKYSGPVSIEDDTELEAWLQVGSTKIGESITKSYTIQARPTYDINKDGYFYVKNGDKYVNVAGRKTVTLVDLTTAQTAAGTVIRLVTANDTVKTLRSQAVDLPGYAKRAMNYVPEMVQLVVSKLHADGSGNILGENGYDAIMAKFNESFDYNLYLEEANGDYRIYGRTPSMKPVVDFYAENKDQVDAKLPQLESFINSAIEKLKAKLNGRGNGVLQEFSVHTIWQKMGGTLTEPVDAESTTCFYEEVLASENNVWEFAYQTAMMYYEPLMNSESDAVWSQLGEYKKYLDKLPQVRPNFKYYIVADGNKVDFISEGNPNSNASSSIWTLQDRDGFTVEFDSDYKLVDGAGTKYYTTLYTDFAYTMPENAKAYYVTGVVDVNENGFANLTEVTDVIPAQTPVLLMTQDEGLEVTVALSKATGTAPTNNLLKGNDWVVDSIGLQTEQLHDLFELVKEKLGETFYNNYLAEYEHLLKLNAGTVNNKYFFGLKAEVAEEVTGLRQLGLQEVEEGVVALNFWMDYSALPANKAFLIDPHDPVYLPLWPDVNRDGKVNINDITAVVDIIKKNDFVPNPTTNKYKFETYDHVVADINGDGVINVNDVTAIVDIVLNLKNH